MEKAVDYYVRTGVIETVPETTSFQDAWVNSDRLRRVHGHTLEIFGGEGNSRRYAILKILKSQESLGKQGSR